VTCDDMRLRPWILLGVLGGLLAIWLDPVMAPAPPRPPHYGEWPAGPFYCPSQAYECVYGRGVASKVPDSLLIRCGCSRDYQESLKYGSPLK
jgi:hypothetical protein